MENKILVADDSPTIQKVISITLANKDYKLDSAHSEDELHEKLGANEYGLVLLDYNLSDTATGVDLAKQIKESNSNTLVMAMLGTFDSIEDSELEGAGFSDKIVKPFESSKFIQKIENLFNSSEEEVIEKDIFDTDDEDTTKNDENTDSFDSDEWSIDGPNVIEEDEDSELLDHSEDNTGNPLAAEMAGWGMSVPEVIGATEEEESLFPPSIEPTESVSFSDTDIDTDDVDKDEGLDDLDDSSESSEDEVFSLEETPIDNSAEELEFGSSSDELEGSSKIDPDLTQEIKIPEELRASMGAQSSEDEISFPDDSDLGYPDMGDDNEEEDTSRRPQLTSLDELDVDDEDGDDEDLDTTDPQIIIGPSEDSPDLINSINDDISPDDFWAADVEDDSQSAVETSAEGEEVNQDIEQISLGDEEEEAFSIDEHISLDDSPKSTELDETSKATLEALSNINDIGPKLESENSDIGPKLEKVDTDTLAQRIKTELLNELKPLIKDMIKEALEEANSETVEKVAWEVIPDLAENLIRKEVKELSQKVIDKHSLN